MAITHNFIHAYGAWGYYAYIEDDDLVIGVNWPREGGVIFRGSYNEAVAKKHMDELKREDTVLYDDIEKYFIKHGVNDEQEDLKKKHSFDEETRTVLFKVKLHMDNQAVHNVLVRGRFQADVIKKLMPPIPEVLTLQNMYGEVFAVRSEKICAVEFVGD